MTAESTAKIGSELFIVDNSDEDWKVLQYLSEWCPLSSSLDIATGYFEIASLLALDGQWQQIDDIRILMGDEVSLKTMRAFQEGLRSVTGRLDRSIEAAKETNDFLEGVPAVVEALRSGKIRCKVYRKDKFHAKAYITHARQRVVGSTALVGSSNFTYPGLASNVELNVQITGTQVSALQEWYEEHWENAEDVTPDILRVIERHTKDYSPFEVYAKSLQEYFRSHQLSATEWEQSESKVYPKLDQYQRDGYQSLIDIGRQHGGAFLCDGVGLGKTFVGLMLIERLVMHDRKRVALFVPKSTRIDVWETALRQYLPDVGGLGGGDFSNLVVFNHTDIGRSGEFPDRLERIKDLADVIVVDEAHHFRNPGVVGREDQTLSRYRQLYNLLDGAQSPKELYMLTATPINNRIDDFRHMMELFTRRDDNYFGRSLGINSVRGHFNVLNRELLAYHGNESLNDEADTDMANASQVVKTSRLFEALVVQRSRAFVKKSQIQQGNAITSFPQRDPPKVQHYSVEKTYGGILRMVEDAFARDKPLFVLGIYYPLAYYIGPDDSIDPFVENRQKQVVRLIRINFLKRFESSVRAFERSCDQLLLKLLTWITKNSVSESEKRRLDSWRRRHLDLIAYVQARQLSMFDESPEDEAEEDVITDEMLEHAEYLENRENYDVQELFLDTYADLDQLVAFLTELHKFEPKNDDKLSELISLLTTEEALKDQKVIIFSEFADTARYLHRQLIEAGVEDLEEIDGSSNKDRGAIIRRFAPYYNGISSGDLADKNQKEIRVLISTDILSEGLNLQDASRLINYDLHWNPVRLMQRIGRVDRRLNPETESRLIADHPDKSLLRGTVKYWNFLPPNELDKLLNLYSRVSKKTLLISKIQGIEGKKLLTPDDEFEAHKDFNEAYEGTTSASEDLLLEFQQLLKDHPDLEAKLWSLPGRAFSGKEHLSKGAKAVFLCYRIPRIDRTLPEDANGPVWTEDAGETHWYLSDFESGKITDEPKDIVDLIRSTPDTPRRCRLERPKLSEVRKKVERQITNTRLKSLQAPLGVIPILKAWMELN